MAGRGRRSVVLRNGSRLADLVLVNLAFLAAYWLRYEAQVGGEVSFQNYVPWDTYLVLELGITAVLAAAYALAGLYSLPQATSLLDELSAVVGSTSMGMMVTLAVAFVYQGYSYSRLIFIFTWALVIVALGLKRIVVRVVRAYLRTRGIGVRRVLVVGSGRLCHMAMHILSTEKSLGYQLIGFLAEEANGDIGRFSCLGSIDQLRQVLREENVDEVVVALPPTSHQRALRIKELCTKEKVPFKFVPDLYEMSLTRLDVNNLRGLPLIGMKDVSIRGGNLVAKRIIDIVAASAVLAVFSPLWLLIAAAIKLDSEGPVLFKQVRLGRSGRPFDVYKFRSMHQDAERQLARVAALNEASGPLFKVRDDPRMTRVGRWLRRMSLDEVPQFINVLKGEMSVVGPRPPIPAEVQKYEDWHRRRLETAPGLTGLWQVSGRSELPFDEMVLLDIYYIENWTLGMDFKILLRTIPAVLTAHGAY